MTRLALEPLQLAPLRPKLSIDPLTLSAARMAAQRAQQPREVTPEEERGLLGSILGGVEYLGSALDKPGAAARGVIHGLTDIAQGDPTPEFGGGLLNLIPFSDAAGITDRSQRLSGRDLLENVGVVSENQPGLGLNSLNPTDWDWSNLGGDLAGFATEVATDPLSYVTGPLGTILKGGKAAEIATPVAKAVAEGTTDLKSLAEVFKKALPVAGSTGQTVTTPVSLANQIRRGERGLAGIKAPRFVNQMLGLEDVPIAQIGAGKEWAAKFVEATGYGRFSPVPWTRAVFGDQTYNKWSPKDQKIADLLFGEKNRLENMMDDLQPAIVAEREKLMNEFNAIGNIQGIEQPEVRRAFDDIAREYILENPNQPVGKDVVKQKMLERLNAADLTGEDRPWLNSFEELNDSYYGYFETLRSTEDAMGRYAESLGLNFKWLKDEFVDHYGRRPSMKVRGSMFEFWKKRDDYLRNVPGGTITINAMGMDPYLTATERLKKGTTERFWGKGQIKKGIAEKYKDVNDDALPKIARKPRKGTLNEYNQYLKSIEGQDIKPWEQTMLPHPDDSRGTTALYKKRYMWDFYYKPAIERTIEKNGLTGEDAAKFFDEQAEIAWNGRLADEGVEALAPKMDQLIDGFASLPEDVLTNGLFDRSTATDYYDYMHSAIKAIANSGYMHGALKQPGIMKLVDNADALGPGETMLTRPWYQAGMTKQGLRTLAIDSFQDELNLDPQLLAEVKAMREQGMTVEEMAQKLGRNAADMTPAQAAKKEISPGYGDSLIWALDDVVARMAAPESVAGMMQMTRQLSSPKVESKLLDVLDAITAGYKSHLTLPFINFHVRNQVGGVVQEATDGKIPLTAVIRGKLNAWNYIWHGKGLQHIDEIKALGVLEGKGWAQDVAADEVVARVGDTIPHGKTGGVAEAFGPARWKARAAEVYGDDATLLQQMAANLNPVAGRGMMESVPPNVLQDAGEHAYRAVEFANRAGYYDELRRAGYSSAQAVHYVNRAHFDYSKLNPFEKGVLRRTMPFYSWTRKSLPYTMAKILEYPGGPTAQTFRAVNRGENPEGVYTPRWMQEQIAAPAAGTPEAQTFVRSFGLPIEDYNKFIFRGGLPAPARTMETFAAQMHPLLTTPIEQMSGRQLYSGRELKNLESPTEAVAGVRMRPLDVVLSRGPWSRAVSTGMDIINPKKPLGLKALNLLTGVKTSTVDTEKARMIDLVNAQRERLEAMPEIRETSHFYLAPRYVGTPVEESRRDELALLTALQRLQKEVLAAKERELPQTQTGPYR